MQVTLKQLRYFVRIVQLGSISRASHDLNIAQTALGLQVRALEESLGATLLLRHPKGVSATELGHLVYDQSQQLLGSVDRLVDEVKKRSDQKSKDIWLGLAPSFMAAIGTRALLTHPEHLPDVQLHLLDGPRNMLLDAVLSGDLDWAITHEVVGVEGIVSIPIVRHSLALITRPGEGPPGGEIQLRDLMDRELVLDSGRRVVSGVLVAAAKAFGVRPNVRYKVDSVQAIKDIIRSEGLAGLFVRSMVREELEHGELEAFSIVNPPLQMTASFIYDARKPPSANDLPALQFIDGLIDEYLADYPSGEVRLGRVTSAFSTDHVQDMEKPRLKVTSC